MLSSHMWLMTMDNAVLDSIELLKILEQGEVCKIFSKAY